MSQERPGMSWWGMTCSVSSAAMHKRNTMAGQIGVNFADRLKTSKEPAAPESTAPDFDLKNSVSLRGKAGVFPGNGPMGVGADVFNSQPNIKNLDDVPGIHLGVTNVGVNLLHAISRADVSAVCRHRWRVTDCTIVGKCDDQKRYGCRIRVKRPAGVRAFITPYVAIFTEYKYTHGTLTFDDAFGPVGIQRRLPGAERHVRVSYHF